MIPAFVVTLSLQSCMTILLITASIVSFVVYAFFILLFLAIFAVILFVYYDLTEKWLTRMEVKRPGFRHGWRGVCMNVILVLLLIIAFYGGFAAGSSVAHNILHD